MLAFLLGFPLGHLLHSFWWPWLDARVLSIAIVSAVALIFITAIKKTAARLQIFRFLRLLLLGTTIGIFHAFLHQQAALVALLPESHEGIEIDIHGFVSGFVQQRQQGQNSSQRLDFIVTEVSCNSTVNYLSDCYPKKGSKIRLNNYQKLQLQSGQHYTLRVKLKRPYGFSNPGGFRYHDWLFINNYVATGYIREVLAKPASGKFFSRGVLSKIRYRISHIAEVRLTTQAADSSTRAIIRALLVGDRSAWPKELTARFQHTGTSHLMAISGLHISLVASLAYLLALPFSRLLLVTKFIVLDSRKISALISIFAALLYALLAGFALPTQRAFIMVTVAVFAFMVNRRIRIYQPILLALCTVLLLEPLALYSSSFWLSFVAVSAILVSLTTNKGSRLLTLLKLQCMIMLALLPVQAFFLGEMSLQAPIANFFAVPWLSVVIVPLAFLSLMIWLMNFSELGFITQCLIWAVQLLEYFLAELSVWPGSRFELLNKPTALLVFISLTTFCLSIGPRSWPGKWPALISLCLFLGFPQQTNKLQNGQFKLTVLDVGQGLAIVARNSAKTLVFDLGPEYSSGFNTAEAVVTPYLKKQGIELIDTLIISHGDSDHAGGLQQFLQAFEVKQLFESEQTAPLIPDGVKDRRRCHAGLAWQWQNVNFTIIHPQQQRIWSSSNNNSCVLHIDTGAGTILIAADIEKDVEFDLLVGQSLPIELQADILIAPHHGSKTSSSQYFVDRVKPRWVIYSTGYRNHFGHPHPAVVARYQAAGAQQLNTASSGAIEIMFEHEKPIHISKHRISQARFWY